MLLRMLLRLLLLLLLLLLMMMLLLLLLALLLLFGCWWLACSAAVGTEADSESLLYSVTIGSEPSFDSACVFVEITQIGSGKMREDKEEKKKEEKQG